ncbi:sulfate transporter CysZ [Candidatus Halobeggiatoa sp. HSG11]|nr:sulfate transporter CysZ [Candidatus Halobeggiatoa sp. HSG11]
MLNGTYYFLRGLILITKPGIRIWVVIPLLINILLFSMLIYYSLLYFPIMLDIVIGYLQLPIPSWAWMFEIILWIILPLFIVFAMMLFFFTFTFVANLISEPFNGALSRAVERYITGHKVISPSESIFKIIVGFILEKLEKLWYYFKWIVLLSIISFIPIINVVSPILWFLFSAWVAALEYADPVLANHGYNVPEQRKLLAKKRTLTLGFGISVIVAMFIPIINFLVMPAAVAGATHMWLQEFDGIDNLQSIEIKNENSSLFN